MIRIEQSEFDLKARKTKPNKQVNSVSHLFSRSKMHCLISNRESLGTSL